jgi:amidase
MPDANTELLLLDATAQAQLVRSGKVSAIELVQASIRRIEELNPHMNAVVTPLFELALERAAAPVNGTFAGVPFLLKDLLATHAGVRQTEGSAFLRDQVAASDSELVKRHRRAGLITLGKTNTCEFGAMPLTEGRLFGPCRNPWSPELNAGGSSGGAAVAVATGMVAMAHGNDGGGSLRNPASCCGVFGFKPSRGRMPFGPHHGPVHSRIVVEHAITRSVRDSAALLDATNGAGRHDLYRLPPPRRAYMEHAIADPPPLRIAFTDRAFTSIKLDEECRAAVRQTAVLCEQLGHDVSEGRPDIEGEGFLAAWVGLWTDGMAWMAAEAERRVGRPARDAELEPLTRGYLQKSRTRSAEDHERDATAVATAGREMDAFLESVDIWLTPALGVPALANDETESTQYGPNLDLSRFVGFSPFARIANAGGQPAMALPLGETETGIPLGTHAVGRHGDEATLFALAGQLERARPWVSRLTRLHSVGGR